MKKGILIKTKDNIILLNEEEINVDDRCYNIETKEFFVVTDINFVIGLNKNKNDYKFLAEHIKIKLSDEVLKEVGYVNQFSLNDIMYAIEMAKEREYINENLNHDKYTSSEIINHIQQEKQWIVEYEQIKEKFIIKTII